MATIEKRVRQRQDDLPGALPRPGWRAAVQGVRSQGGRPAVPETRPRRPRPGYLDRPGAGAGAVPGLVGEWWATTTNLRPKTRDRDELLLRRMALPSFGAVPLAAISQRDVRAWVAGAECPRLGAGHGAEVLSAPGQGQGRGRGRGHAGADAVPAGAAAQDRAGGDTSRPRPRSPPWPRPSRLATAPWSWSAPTAGCASGELAGLRRRRVDLLRGTVTVAEIVVEVRGVAVHRPPKTRASRRTVGLPRFVVDELPHTWLSRVTRRASCSPRRRVACCGSPTWTRVWRPAIRAAGVDGLRIHDLRHTAVALSGSRPAPIPQGEVAARAGHALSQLHPRPLRPPVPGGRHRAPRPA